MHYIQPSLSEKKIINICQELEKNISVKNVNI